MQRCKVLCTCPYGWTDDIYHVGSALEFMSFSQGVPIAGGIGVRHGRQTFFPWLIQCVSKREQRKLSVPIPPHSAVHRLDLKLAELKKDWYFGKPLWQTTTCATILFESMPENCVLKCFGRYKG